MAAYVIASVEVTDPEVYAEYRARVSETIERYGGRFLVRGGASEILEGSWDPPRVVVLEFPDAETARRWHGSEEYRPLIELRQRASEGHLLLVEGVQAAPREIVLPGRVAWVDTDAGGRIHFTAAFRYAEAAETALMREAGMLEGWGDYPRRRVEAEFRRVLRFEDEFEARLRVERVGTTSVTYAWEVVKGGEAYVEGRHTVVHVGPDGRPAPLPDEIRSALASQAAGHRPVETSIGAA